MAQGKQVSVGDTATEIHGSAAVHGTDVYVFNSGSNPVQLGGSGVTFGSGFELPASQSVTGAIRIPLDASESIYGICDSTLSTTVQVLVLGV